MTGPDETADRVVTATAEQLAFETVDWLVAATVVAHKLTSESLVPVVQATDPMIFLLNSNLVAHICDR